MKLTLMRTVVAAYGIVCITGCAKDSSSTDSSKHPDITRDLVAYYSFDSNLLADSSKNNAAGAVNHGVQLTAGHRGNPNSAAFFADSAYIEIPASPETDLHKDFTLNAWVNLTNDQSTDLLTAVVSKGDSLNYIWQMGMSKDFASGEYGTGQSFVVKYINLKDPTPLAIGQWYMLTMTLSKSSGTATLYVNGSQAASFSEQGVTSTDVSVADSNPILIGMERSRHFWFDGKLDDLRIYDRVISPEEISLLYTQ